jgi:hypothetical protein
LLFQLAHVWVRRGTRGVDSLLKYELTPAIRYVRRKYCTSTQRNGAQHNTSPFCPCVLATFIPPCSWNSLTASSCHDGALHLPKTPDRPRKLAAWPAWQTMLESPSSALQALQAIPSPALRATTQVRRLGFVGEQSLLRSGVSGCQPLPATRSHCQRIIVQRSSGHPPIRVLRFLTFQTDHPRKISWLDSVGSQQRMKHLRTPCYIT